MASQTIQPTVETSEKASYYIWKHPRSPYIIELNLELVDRLRADIAEARSSGMEIGGLLVGYCRQTAATTVRVDDYQTIGRRAGDAAAYVLGSKPRERFSSQRSRLTEPLATAVGMFRTDFRDGSLILSHDDRKLLSEEFGAAVHVALLIRTDEPHTAAFLVPEVDGAIQEGQAYAEFPFEQAKLQQVGTDQGRLRRRRWPWNPANFEGPWAAVSRILPFVALTLGLVALGGGLFLTHNAAVREAVAARSLHLGVSAAESPNLLEVRWNPRMSLLSEAQSATLIVTTTARRRLIPLTLDQLKTGRADIPRVKTEGDLVLDVTLPQATHLTQSIRWAQDPGK